MILAHGNGGNRSSMLSRSVFLSANGYNAFPIDLRAHGESAGNYMTTGYLEALDILGAVEAVKQRGEKGPFVAMGHSYGARASLWAAAHSTEISAVIADCAFVSIYDALKREAVRVVNDPKASFGQKVGMRMVNVLAGQSPARRFTEWAYYLRTGFRYEQYDDAMNAVSLIGERPILFITGEKDQTAPPEDSQRMHDAVRSPLKAIVVVPGANHKSTFDTDPAVYKAKVLAFLDAAVSR